MRRASAPLHVGIESRGRNGLCSARFGAGRRIAVPAIALDKSFASLLQVLTGQQMPLLISGGVGLLLYAYLARFLGVGLHAIESGLSKITTSIEDAARSMGASANDTLRRVHLPMMRSSVAMAALLVLVDVLKELPATFVLRLQLRYSGGTRVRLGHGRASGEGRSAGLVDCGDCNGAGGAHDPYICGPVRLMNSVISSLRGRKSAMPRRSSCPPCPWTADRA